MMDGLKDNLGSGDRTADAENLISTRKGLIRFPPVLKMLCSNFGPKHS